MVTSLWNGVSSFDDLSSWSEYTEGDNEGEDWKK